jgi:ABC-type transport system involved in cytochrome bd biosynthesis fused ATPase/permease subunit
MSLDKVRGTFLGERPSFIVELDDYSFYNDSVTLGGRLRNDKKFNRFIGIIEHLMGDKRGDFNGGTELSGGQWQKLAIARSYMRAAAIAMLDEPTAALDPKAESDVLRQFLATSKDKTAFIVSHRLGLARFCDRIIMMQDGRIIEQGSHSELVRMDGEYARLWAMQSQWYN